MMTKTEPRHELDLGGLDFTGRTDYGGITFQAMAEGATLGNPQPAYRDIASALQDGSVSAIDRYGNREPAFQVWIKASDSVLLDRGQIMLNNACKNRPLLGWRPADGVVERRIYVCQTAHPNYIFDDLSELPDHNRILHRRFDLRLVCDPWSYSPELTVVEAVPAGTPVTPVNLPISDGTSATGWTSPSAAVAQPSVSSGKIWLAPREDNAATPVESYVSEGTLALSPTDFSATNYIGADIKPKSPQMELSVIPENYNDKGWGGSKPGAPDAGYTGYRGTDLGGAVAAYVDGNKLPLKNYVAQSDGSIRFTWVSTDNNASSVRIIGGTTRTESSTSLPSQVNRGILIDNITRSNVEPGRSTTGRATSLVVDYDGSARTTPSVEVSSATGGLGDLLIYSAPVLGKQGYEPSCRPYLSLIGMTDEPDAATISGRRTRDVDELGMTFDIPSSRLPVGTYGIMPRFRWVLTAAMGADDLVNIPVTVSHIVNGETYFETSLPVEPGIAGVHAVGNQPWQWRTIGVAALPPNEIPASDTSTSFIRIKFGPQVDNTSGSVDFELDDLLLLWQGAGAAMTRVDCGTGTPLIGSVHNRVWLNQPTPFDPKPRAYVGTQADKSDAFNPGLPALSAHGIHPINPGANLIYVANTGDPYPKINYGFHKAYA